MANGFKRLLTALAASALVVGTAWAGPPSDGLSLRAAGFFEAEASGGEGTCTVPGIANGIAVSSDTMGLWNQFGIQWTQYPDPAVLGVCKGWLQVQNVMTSQGISVDRVEIRLRIAGAGRFRQFVPTRNGFPTACRSLRRYTVFSGAHLFPLGTPPDFGNTGSGAAHVAFINMFPMVTSQVIHCLREQYAALPSNVFVSLPLVIKAVATGITDSGQRLKSNPNQFTLNLLHLCGNGRVEFGEQCDPNAPNTCGAGLCDTESGTCRANEEIACLTDADCQGTCIPQGDPSECACLYGGN